jgi:hypothetical protein
MPPGGLLKLHPLDSRHRQPIRIVLLAYVGELKMAAPSEEKLICDKFNLEALTVNQVKSFKALADGKDVFIGTKTGSGIFAYISSITCAPCKTSSDWIRVLVAVTNEILKRESSKCILDPAMVERRGARIVTLG